VLFSHVFDGAPSFFLDRSGSARIFLRRLGRLFRQLRTSSATNSEAQSMLAGARRFDRGVERKQIGLFGQVVK